MATEAQFYAFVQSIPNVKKRGTSDLHECIIGSAICNASDTVREYPQESFWDIALTTAKMIADDWRSYYPELES
jgi:hypothetical protein